MKAMILAAGFGTRLGEIGKTLPKCLLEVGGKTMLEHVVERLGAAGVSGLVINAHHLAEAVQEFVERKKNFGMPVSFSFEKQIQGTGGGIKAARELLGENESFFVHNADIYSEFDLCQLWESHSRTKALATLAVMQRETTRPLLFDREHCLKGWIGEDGQGQSIATAESLTKLAFSGIQVVSPKIFDYMNDFQIPFSSIAVYMQASRNGARVIGQEYTAESWMDVGTPEKLEKLRMRLAARP